MRTFRPYPLHLFSIFFVILWCLCSLWFLATGNADMFQRMGALGVALFVLVFGAVLHTTASESRLANQSIQDRLLAALKELKLETNVLLDYVSTDSDVFWREIYLGNKDGRNPISDNQRHKILDLVEKRNEDIRHHLEGKKERTKRFESLIEDLQRIYQQSSSSSSRATVGEIFFLIVATFQWGFGDLLVAAMPWA
jgi:hypothetical protein